MFYSIYILSAFATLQFIVMSIVMFLVVFQEPDNLDTLIKKVYLFIGVSCTILSLSNLAVLILSPQLVSDIENNYLIDLAKEINNIKSNKTT